MTISARHQLSEMTETTERTLAVTFDWRTPEERLYRDCPSAFWLAPDGDEALPPVNGPMFAAPPKIVHAEARPAPGGGHPATVDGCGWGITKAVHAAGPIFAAALGLTLDFTGGMSGSWFGQAALASLLLLPFTILGGVFLGAIPIVTGTLGLSRLGVRNDLARTRWLWSATGAGMGLGIAGLFDAQIVTLPLVLTSAACAAIAHSAITWHDPEPA